MLIIPAAVTAGEGNSKSNFSVRIDSISIRKNWRTRENIIMQELDIKTGDIVTQLGEYKINSVESYMQALGKFKKGDATKVVVKRGAEEKTFDIVF